MFYYYDHMEPLTPQTRLNLAANLEVGTLPYPNEVYTCNKETPLSIVVDQMRQRNIGCAVITDQNTPIGIFTERDLLKKVAKFDSSAGAQKIESVMTPKPVCIQESLPIRKALNYMRAGRFRHLIIVDSQGQLKGIISIKDFLDFMVDTLNES